MITLIIKRVVEVTLGVSILLSFAAGTTPESGQNGAGAAPSIPRIVSDHPGSPYSLLNEFTLDSEPLGKVAENIQTNVGACMNREGWKYWNPTDFAFNSEYTDLKNFWKFRITEGFGVSSQVIIEAKKRLVPITANFQYLATLASSQRLAYWLDLTGSTKSFGDYAAVPLTIPGSGAKGCEATARRKVLGPLPYFQDKTRRAFENLYAELSSSRAVVVGTRNWEKCMATSGFSVRYFDQEEAAYFQKSSKLTLRSAERDFPIERTTAVIDARCFLEYLYPRETAYSRTLLRIFAKTFPKYDDSITRLLRR